MARKNRVLHYINQFFGGIGGEEKSGMGFLLKEGPVGPGLILNRVGGDRWEVVATLICGDNHVSENLEESGKEAVKIIGKIAPDFVIAGPAFNAGRYGLACGHICHLVQEDLKIPAITAMYPENAGADMYRSKIYILKSGEVAKNIEPIMKNMGEFALRLKEGVEIGPALIDGYIPRGFRRNLIDEKPAAVRAVSMLLKKMQGEILETELPLPDFDKIPPPAPLTSVAKSRIAIMTTSGVVPKGNPDRMPVGRSREWYKYKLVGVNDLSSETYEAHHAGYETRFVDTDPNRALPIDMLRELETEGRIGKIHDYYYTLSGQGTYVDAAKRIGATLADEMVREKIDGVILTST